LVNNNYVNVNNNNNNNNNVYIVLILFSSCRATNKINKMMLPNELTIKVQRSRQKAT